MDDIIKTVSLIKTVCAVNNCIINNCVVNNCVVNPHK